jgi:sialate O-acetylesterase
MRLAAFALALMAASPASAAPLLHPMFQDHAVLQRDQPIRIYGQAPSGTQISIRLGNASATARAAVDGQWSASLPAMPMGGPYTLQVSGGGESQQISDVLLGDVFLCTGQSNMALSVRRAANFDAETAAATDGAIRMLTIDRVASPAVLKTFSTPVSWKVASPQTVQDFSASCFFFARELRKTVKTPIGLVTAAWGGTRVRGWVSHPSLRKLTVFNDDLDMLALQQRDADAASKRWDAAWESWWRANGKGEPWKEDTSAWPTAPQPLHAWGDWPGLSLPDGTAESGVGFVGQLWLSTHVTLTPAQAAQAATLELGRINEEEKSWVNGRGIGGTSQQPSAVHALPKGLLKAGDNSITLNIFCSWRNCGLTGPDTTRLLRFADGSSLQLDKPWRYKAVETLIAPQLPWGPMHGVGLQYNGMIAPIGSYGVKGAVWYQGESNLYFAKTYQPALEAMMRDWRQQFGAGLPFLIVQIPNYGLAPAKPGESLWSDVREAQRKTAEADAKAALVVTFDVGDAKNLHPPNKQEIGRRLSIAARNLVYGENIPPSGARVASARRTGDTVTILFQDVTGALQAYNGEPNAFELCDATSCRWARASATGNNVTLTGAGAATRVRYCWGDNPICTLSDASGLPAGPFEIAIAP